MEDPRVLGHESRNDPRSVLTAFLGSSIIASQSEQTSFAPSRGHVSWKALIRATLVLGLATTRANTALVSAPLGSSLMHESRLRWSFIHGRLLLWRRLSASDVLR